MRISVRGMRDDHSKGDLIGITMDKLPKSLKTDFKKIANDKNYKSQNAMVHKSFHQKAIEMFV